MDNTSTLSSTQMQLKKDHLFYLYCVNGIFSLIYFILAISVSNKCFVSPCEEYGSPGFIQMFRVRSRYYMYIYNKTLLVFFLSYYIYIYIYIVFSSGLSWTGRLTGMVFILQGIFAFQTFRSNHSTYVVVV